MVLTTNSNSLLKRGNGCVALKYKRWNCRIDPYNVMFLLPHTKYWCYKTTRIYYYFSFVNLYSHRKEYYYFMCFKYSIPKSCVTSSETWWRSGMMVVTARWDWTVIYTYEVVAHLNKYFIWILWCTLMIFDCPNQSENVYSLF